MHFQLYSTDGTTITNNICQATESSKKHIYKNTKKQNIWKNKATKNIRDRVYSCV